VVAVSFCLAQRYILGIAVQFVPLLLRIHARYVLYRLTNFFSCVRGLGYLFVLQKEGLPCQGGKGVGSTHVLPSKRNM
jgi:hypothetical protein